MKLMIGYTTSEGQTRKIARRVAHHVFKAGHSVELLNLEDAESLDLAEFDRIILLASVHTGHFQRAYTEFVTAHAEQLEDRPTLFLPVSLAAARHDAEEWRGLDRILVEVSEATGWTPDAVFQAAGAYRPSQYDFFRRFLMRRIIAARDPDANPDTDKEYTDWSALYTSLNDWLADKDGATPTQTGCAVETG